MSKERAPVTAGRPGVPVVATVDNVPIYEDEVTALMAEADAGLSAESAVDALVRHRLLTAEARRRRFDTHPRVAATRKVARASAVLDAVVNDAVTAETISEARVNEHYRRYQKRFVHDTMRRVVHFVALTGKKKLTNDEARRLADVVYGAVQGARSEDAFKSRAESVDSRHLQYGKVESLPAFEKNSKQFVAPFVDAVFALSGVGAISAPVQTKFGWHVIYVAEETPAVNRSLSEVREEILAELLPIVRREAAAALMQRLMTEGQPFVYEEHLKPENGAP